MTGCREETGTPLCADQFKVTTWASLHIPAKRFNLESAAANHVAKEEF